MLRRFLAVLVSVAFLLGVSLTTRYFILVKKYKQQAARIVIRDVNLSRVPDGVYTGACDIGFVADEVRVTVEAHKVVAIQVVRDVSQRGRIALPILARVVAAQSLHVDTVSGATNSSKVILKAVENPLDKY